MRNIVWVILLVAVARAQPEYKLCAPADAINEDACYVLQRGESKVSCLRAADSADCAIRLAQGEAHFGVFNAEELFLMYQFFPSDTRPIIQLRHRDKRREEFEFQTVAVIPTDLMQIDIPPNERLQNLKGGGLCHPGFSKTQWWNDYTLKYFEKTVTLKTSICQENLTVIENEVQNLKDFFGKACRPGEWAADDIIDQKLKLRYRELCELCDDPTTCSYSNTENHGHRGALECLTQRKGKVAYLALSYVQQYLRANQSFQFLCPNGDVFPLSTAAPCTWLKQPWSVVAAREDIADTLKSKLLEWLQNPQKEDWKIALGKIIQEDGQAVDITEKLSLGGYLSKGGRQIDPPNIESCQRTIRWCTIGDLETNKCVWVSRAAANLGVAPTISCVKANSTFECFREIGNDRADIMTIDSNYGLLARTVYGLSTVLYSETDTGKNSVILAVVREPNDDNYPVKSFHDLKGRRACFPEYSGIGWMGFAYVARMHNVISTKSCDYPSLMANLLSGACAPGIQDSDHSNADIPKDISSKLCSACQNQNNTSCAANEGNRYYGDKGALRCVSEGAGDVAFIEAGNIDDVDSRMYRTLCKNGSLAATPGFVYDELCALSVTIDSELVGRRNRSQILTDDTILALLKLEDWLGYRINTKRPIHIYGPFNSTYDLLFKDSTSGLVPTSSEKKSVFAYKELFKHIEACSTGSFAATANFILVALGALYHFLSGHVH